MPKKIKYVANKLVYDQYSDFRDKELATIEIEVSEKYKSYFSKNQFHAISSAVCGTLTVALYLECARYRDFPSYQHQLLLIRDFRQLLESTKPKPQYAHLSDYKHCYDRLCLLFSEQACYSETGTLSEAFFNKLRLSNEGFPMEYAGKYLDYTEEITCAVIEAMTNMVLDQIFTFFPSEGPAFYKDLFDNSGIEAHNFEITDITEDNNDQENPTNVHIGRRVTFSV